MNEENSEENGEVNAEVNPEVNDEENGSESVHPVNSPVTYEEYFAALNIWLRNSYTMMNMHMQFLTILCQYNQTLLANQPQDMNTPSALNIPPSNITSGHTQAQTTPDMAARPRRPEGAILYIIPRLWKRLAAELIDFFILFVFRFFLSFFLVDILGIIELNEFLIEKFYNMGDYDAAMRIISEIIYFEIIHLIIVFIYEGYYLQKQADIQHMGGATPGKIFMSLRVVKCDQVIPVEPEPSFICWVKPGTNLDCKYSFARSFMKNILLLVLFPLRFVDLFEYNRTGYLLFQYNRTRYDVICHTLVVEVVDDE